MGRVVLSTMGSLAQFYSDNLSTETKKGKRSGRRRGICNGLLPFGIANGDGGIPVASSDTHVGVVLAFKLAATGQTDLEVARAEHGRLWDDWQQGRECVHQGQRPADASEPVLSRRIS
jgi:DNA invertase Pin-like site-specific DNA recombinase